MSTHTSEVPRLAKLRRATEPPRHDREGHQHFWFGLRQRGTIPSPKLDAEIEYLITWSERHAALVTEISGRFGGTQIEFASQAWRLRTRLLDALERLASRNNGVVRVDGTLFMATCAVCGRPAGLVIK